MLILALFVTALNAGKLIWVDGKPIIMGVAGKGCIQNIFEDDNKTKEHKKCK